MPFDYIVSNNNEYLIDENGNFIINGESDVTDITINYYTVISFPDSNPHIMDVTGGIGEDSSAPRHIENGTLLVDKILYNANIKVGEINSSRFEVTIYSLDEDVTGEKIYVYLQHRTEPDTKIPMFTGIVDSCKLDRDERYRKIVAYDEFYTKGNIDLAAKPDDYPTHDSWWDTFWDTHGSGATIQEIRVALLQDFNIEVAPDMRAMTFVNDTNFKVLQFAGLQSLKLGTLFSYIAELNGVNPYFDAEGYIRYYSPKDSPSTTDIDNKFESPNTNFEAFTTMPISNVMLLAEENIESGNYPSSGATDNAYVIKDNPLVYNIVPLNGHTQKQTYDEICENIYDILDGISYTPAKIKMILSMTGILLGDYVTATVKDRLVSTLVSKMTISGSLFIEQSITGAGNEKLPVADYTPLAGQIAEVQNTTKKVSEHFVWVQGDGAYVTTDATPAGSAPTTNFSKLTSSGLNVTAQGKDVAFFGVDSNIPITRLGIEDEQHLIVSNNSMEMLTIHQDPFFHVGKLPTAVPVSHIDTSVTFDNATAQSSDILKINTTYFGNTFTEAPYTLQFTVSRGSDSVSFLVDNWTQTDVSFNSSSTDVTLGFGANSRARLETYLGTIQAGDVFTVTMRGTYKYTVDVNQCIMSFGDNDFSQNGDYSTVLGLRNTATNRFAIAGGWYNDVSGEAGVALGTHNSVANTYSSALGTYLTTAGNAQVVLGRFNSPITNSPFIVGDGYVNAPHNAIWVDSNGNTNFGGQVISTTIGSYHNMPHLKWNEIDPQGGSASSIEVRAVGSNQQAVAMIDVNGNHHVLSDEQGQFIPEKADTSALNAVVSALGSVTVAGNFNNLDVSDDEDLVDLEVGTYLVIVDFNIQGVAFPLSNPIGGTIAICDNNNTPIDFMLSQSFAIPVDGTYIHQHIPMFAAVTVSATKPCHVEYRESSGGTEANASIRVVYVKLK